MNVSRRQSSVFGQIILFFKFLPFLWTAFWRDVRFGYHKASRARIILYFLLIATVINFQLIGLPQKVTVTVKNQNVINGTKLLQSVGIHQSVWPWQLAGQSDYLKHKLLADNNLVRAINFDHRNGQVVVTVTEKTHAGFLSADGKWYAIIDTELIEVNQPDGHAPNYVGFNRNNYQKTASQFAKLTKAIQNNIGQIKNAADKSNPDKIMLYMNDGNTVIANNTDYASKLQYYPAITAKMQEKGIIDLQVGAYSKDYKK